MKQNKRKTKPASVIKRIKAKLRALTGKPDGSPNGTYNSYYPRHLARSVAKANMARAGVQHINRNFAYNWRNWVHR